MRPRFTLLALVGMVKGQVYVEGPGDLRYHLRPHGNSWARSRGPRRIYEAGALSSSFQNDSFHSTQPRTQGDLKDSPRPYTPPLSFPLSCKGPCLKGTCSKWKAQQRLPCGPACNPGSPPSTGGHILNFKIRICQLGPYPQYLVSIPSLPSPHWETHTGALAGVRARGQSGVPCS